MGLNSGVRMAGRDALAGSVVEPSEPSPTLADAGIDKKLSSRAQKLAAMPEEIFEKTIAQWRAGQAELLLIVLDLKDIVAAANVR